MADRPRPPAPSDDQLRPIAGVDLATYARIVKASVAYNYDSSLLPALAAHHGVDEASWVAAHRGWNERIRGDPALARRFTEVYHDG